MKEKLIRYFSNITTLTPAEINMLTSGMEVKHFDAGNYVVKAGQVHQNTYFVLEGLLRQFNNQDGNEITTHFYGKEDWIMSLAPFNQPNFATENLVCVKSCSLVIGDETKAQAIFKEYPRLETVARAVMEKVFASQQQRMQTFLTNTPEQRYLNLLATKPDLLQEVPQYQIASYLGITAESLSRIRKRIAQKK